MSIVSFKAADDNPVTEETVKAQLAKLDVSLFPGGEEDFRSFSAAAHETAKTVEAMDDFKPTTDVVRFPRKSVGPPNQILHPVSRIDIWSRDQGYGVFPMGKKTFHAHEHDNLRYTQQAITLCPSISLSHRPYEIANIVR